MSARFFIVAGLALFAYLLAQADEDLLQLGHIVWGPARFGGHWLARVALGTASMLCVFAAAYIGLGRDRS